MQWSDEAILLAVRRHGDSSVVVEALTRSHGRHLGLVRGGRSRSLAATLQPGNSVGIRWQARLEEHLGQFTVEPVRLRAASLMGTAEGLFSAQVLSGHLHLLAEREPHAALYDVLSATLDWIAGEARPDLDELAALLARFELLLLDELGFGLDLTRCARTGTTAELVYVSPRSGRAVSRQGAIGYETRLLPLPAFLTGDTRSNRSPADIADGLRLTGYFLERDLYAAHGLPMPTLRTELLERLSGDRRRPLSA